MELSLGILFRGFNVSKCILYLSLLLFVILVSLKLDNRVGFSYAFVFAPLWSCNLLVFAGAIIGACSFCAKPPSRNEIALRVDFAAMLLTAVEHVFLCAFVTFAFVKLELEPFLPFEHEIPWTIVFCPLFTLAIVSVGVAIWAMRHDKPFEFEFLYAINIVEMVFVAFKLDKQVDWSWAVVFIPLWVVLSLSAVGVVYALVLSIVLARSRHFLPSHRRQHVYSALLHTMLVVPALICLVLLTGKLDALHWTEKEPAADIPYTMVFLPLMLSLGLSAAMAIGVTGTSANGTASTNVWWFGLRQPFCPFILEACPPLRQYANVSYKVGVRKTRPDTETEVALTQEAAPVVIREVNECRQGSRVDKKKAAVSETTPPNEPGINVANALKAYRAEYGHFWKSSLTEPD
ncbi:unnamed protein product [Caenorhabditis auriculariae]|uniref:Uncharacterized protein n=1 Tax=Caenorhabditis auriculariae TaxID=2777116 RepID=A0A8S1H9R1_9PELO|nr:unnamed protein product [Caenorhabditis auriculariae]